MPQRTKEEKAEYMRQWRTEKAEHRRQYRLQYAAEHQEEISAYNSTYYFAHKEEIRPRNNRNTAKYYRRHREEVLAKNALRYALNRAKILAYFADLYQRDRDRILARCAKYRAEHPDKRQALNSAWWKANPGKTAQYNFKRRSSIRNAAICDFTDEEWDILQQVFDFRCVYCGEKAELTRDHLTPVSQGGNHTLHNILPGCQTCNSKKNDGPVPSPVQPLLLAPIPLPKKKKA